MKKYTSKADALLFQSYSLLAFFQLSFMLKYINEKNSNEEIYLEELVNLGLVAWYVYVFIY